MIIGSRKRKTLLHEEKVETKERIDLMAPQERKEKEEKEKMQSKAMNDLEIEVTAEEWTLRAGRDSSLSILSPVIQIVLGNTTSIPTEGKVSIPLPTGHEWKVNPQHLAAFWTTKEFPQDGDSLMGVFHFLDFLEVKGEWMHKCRSTLYTLCFSKLAPLYEIMLIHLMHLERKKMPAGFQKGYLLPELKQFPDFSELKSLMHWAFEAELTDILDYAYHLLLNIPPDHLSNEQVQNILPSNYLTFRWVEKRRRIREGKGAGAQFLLGELVLISYDPYNPVENGTLAILTRAHDNAHAYEFVYVHGFLQDSFHLGEITRSSSKLLRISAQSVGDLNIRQFEEVGRLLSKYQFQLFASCLNKYRTLLYLYFLLLFLSFFGAIYIERRALKIKKIIVILGVQ